MRQHAPTSFSPRWSAALETGMQPRCTPRSALSCTNSSGWRTSHSSCTSPALVDAHLGNVDEARTAAERGAAIAAEAGQEFWAIANRRVLGLLELSLDNPSRAVEYLQPPARGAYREPLAYAEQLRLPGNGGRSVRGRRRPRRCGRTPRRTARPREKESIVRGSERSARAAEGSFARRRAITTEPLQPSMRRWSSTND